jgi:hypothetical protein
VILVLRIAYAIMSMRYAVERATYAKEGNADVS